MSEKMIDREYIKNMPEVIQLHELKLPCKCEWCEAKKKDKKKK